MNKAERAAALALSACRMPQNGPIAGFVRSMRWLAENEPGTVLSPSQRWYLACAVYRFRRQLAGREDLEIPAAPPARAEFEAAAELRAEKRRQALERRHGRKPDQGALF